MTFLEYAIANKKIKRDLFVEAKDKYSEYDVYISEYTIKFGSKVIINEHEIEFNSSNSIKIDGVELLKGEHRLVSESETIEFTCTYNKICGYGFYATVKIATC